MRYFFYSILASVFLMTSCTNNDDTIVSQDLIGSWKIVGANISAGGPQYWIDIENGEEISFSNNGLFSSNKFSECTNGDFSVESSELFLKYRCNGFTTGFENPEGAITYKITFESTYFLLTPSSVMCVEGCSYKYIRI